MFKGSISRKVFVIFNYLFITLVCIICIYPFLNTLAVSFSSKGAVNAGKVGLFPVEFQLDAYEFILESKEFYTAFGVSIKRVALALLVSMTMTVLAAYPISKSTKIFPKRDIYVWFYFFTMLFGGGLIPGYLVVKATGLMDTIWALVIPSAVPVGNIILLQNYFKSLPDEIYDSARIDGAGEWRILLRIFLPLSKPVLATIVLYVAVAHWNDWFTGMIYMNRLEHYPLQSYLQTLVVEIDAGSVTDINQIKNISTRNNKAAQIIVAMLPILCMYPFVQKYFTKGIVMGSVKG